MLAERSIPEINEPMDVVLNNLRRWFGELRIVNPFTDETHERPRFSHVLDSIAQRKPYARYAIQLFRRRDDPLALHRLSYSDPDLLTRWSRAI